MGFENKHTYRKNEFFILCVTETASKISISEKKSRNE